MVRPQTYPRKNFIKMMAGAAIALPALRLIDAPELVEARVGNQQLGASRPRTSRFMHVQSIDFSHQLNESSVLLEALVHVTTGTSSVADASVSVRFTLADGSLHSQVSKTDGNGIARFTRDGAGYGTYRVDVASVKRGGMVYQSANNLVSSATIEIQEPAPAPVNEPVSEPSPTLQEPLPTEDSASVLNVRDFGAHGDGVSDDSEAIQRAVNKSAESGGGTVFLPAGTYRLGSTIWLDSGVQLTGESRDLTELSATADMNILEIISKSNVGISNLTLRRTNSLQNWGYGLMVWDSKNVTIKSSRFLDMPDAAIYLMRAGDVTISNCEFTNLRMTGIRLAPSGEGFGNRHIRITNNVFSNVNSGRFDGHSAVHCHGGDEPGIKNEYVWIEDNYVQSGGIGLGLDNIDHGVVARNRIVGSGISGEGIAFTGSNNRIVDNVVDNNYAAGILLWGVSYRSNSDNVISNNTCWDNAQGIAVVCGGHGSVVENLEVSSNRCYAERSNSKQQFGIQHYIDGTQDFTWRNVRFVQNDLRGNTVWAWNIIPPAYAEFVDNIV